MIAKPSALFRNIMVIGRNDTPFSGSSEILARIETERGSVSQCPHIDSVIGRPMSMCAIGKHLHAVLPGDRSDLFHGGRVTVEMNGEDGPGA